jgi:hypothetical protein
LVPAGIDFGWLKGSTMNPSMWTAIQPILAQAARDFLRTVGMFLAAHGYITNGGAGVEAFIGAGMTLAGLFWGWFTTSGYLQLAGLLKKLTATKTPADAVKAATVLPGAAAVDTPSKSAVVKSVTNILLIAFACSLFLASSQAFAQTRRAADPIQQIGDKLKAGFTAKTGVQATGDLGFDLLRMLDAKLLPDLQYAQKLADANKNSLTSACWGAWIGVIQTNQTAVQTKNADGTSTDIAIPDPHLITDLERAIDIRNALQPDAPFMRACSPVANLIKTDVMNFIGQVVGGGLSLTKLVPGLL